jgi:hypothetical protein
MVYGLIGNPNRFPTPPNALILGGRVLGFKELIRTNDFLSSHSFMTIFWDRF